MDLTAGIPTSTAFDTKPVFGENPWDAEERDYNERVATWRRDQTEKLDAAVLDPDTFFQGADFGTAPDPARAMREATNDSALAFYLDREPDMDTTSMQRAIDRQEAAIRFFDGRGADSEESFHAELVAAATRRKDRGTLFQSMSREAGAAATVAAIDPTAPKAGWPAVRAKLAAMPGFTPETEAALAESYATAQREIQASMDGYRPQLAAVWDAFVNNGDTKTAAADTYAALADPKDRRAFLASLRILADSMPEEKRPEFWRNFSRTFERDLFNYLDSAGTAVVTNTAMLNEVRRSFNDPTYIPTPADVRQREALQTQDAETRRRADFLADVRTIQQENFDPIAWITPEGSWKRVLESGAYHAPGALVTSASVLIPGVGQPAFYAASQEMAYQQFRTTFEGSGMSYEDASAKASTLAPIAAIPQVLAERLQISAFAGRLPVFEKVIAKANASISSRLGQFATRAVATGIEESALEQAQNYIPSFVQDIAHALEMDVPDVEWRNGKDGVLDGFWKDSAEMLVTMLPLAIIGAGRGVIADNQRVSTLAQATDDQLLALGAKPEDVSGFRMAQGFGAQAAAMETMLENADPTAESAQAATTRMENAAIATERARLLGLLPRAEVNAGGWTLSDPETGATIGTASNWMDATRIASAHAQLTEEDNAATVAYIATTFQAAEAATVRGTGEIDEAGRNRRTSFIIDLDTRKTAEQAAAESQEAGARVFSEVNLMEESETGEARGTLVVFGESRTTFEKRQRQTVNKLHQGANVLTLFEEEIHGWRREAHAAGRLNRADDLAILRATDQILGGKSRILPANFDQLSAYDQDVAIDEGIAALAQAEVLRTRKQSGGRFDLAPGMVSKNLSAYARLMDSRAFASFRGFLRAVRSFFGLAMDRAKLLEQGRAEDPEFSANLDTYLDNLLGLSQQTDHEQAARDAEAAILDGLADYATATADTPFSLGRDQRNQDSRPIDPNQPGGANIGDAASPSSFVTPEMDAAYLDAVESGDMEVAQRMVDEAAKGKTPDPSKIWLSDYRWAFQKGRKHRDTGDFWSFYSGPLQLAYNAGREDRYESWENWNPNQIVVGYRFGKPREDGASYNAQSASGGPSEPGISLMAIKGEDPNPASDLWGVQLTKNRQKTWVYGYLLPETGGDGEPSLWVSGLPNYDISASTGKRDIPMPKYDPVEYDSAGNIIALSKRFNQPPAAGSAETSFSLARAAAELEGSALARIRDPKRRAQAMQRIAERMRDLHLQLERIELAAGGKRLARSLRREAAVREAMRAEELENDAYARHWQVFSNEDLTKLKEQPVHAHLANPDSHLHGRLMSKSAAIKAHPDLFRLHRAGDYDGADGVSRSVFGGRLMPDQAAQELYDAGLIQSPTTDALWDALLKEQAFVAGMKETLAKAKADIAEARRIAKQETNQWLAEQTGTQVATYSAAEEIRRSLAMLDAILNVVPNEVRGKVGKYAATQLARIGTDANRLAFLREKLAATDEALGVWLAKQLDREFRELLQRARPQKTDAGQKPTGKITADIHTLFRQIEAAMLLTAAEGEAEALKLEHLAANEEQTTPAERSHLTLQAEMIRLVADWPNADAARREAALLEATRLYEGGYMSHLIEVSRKAERREHARMSLAGATGKAGTRPEIEARRKQDTRSKKARMKSMLKGLLSFEQLVHLAFGKDNPDGNNLVEWERSAAYAKHDAVMAADSAVEQLLADLAGSKYKGEELRAKLGRPDAIAIDGHNGRETFSELEAITATLMFRQADGRRHMEGHLNDAGEPVGEWHYNAEMIADIERQLSPQAKAVRLHLIESYAAEYDRINSVYRQIYGVDLPRHANYSPLTVAPMQAQSGQTVDPVTGFAYSGAGFTPGALKTRSVSAIAKPDFRDALMTYLGHTRQMEHFIAYAPFAQEAAALLNNRNVGDAVKAASGEQSLALLRGWIDHFGLGGNRDAEAMIDLYKGISRMSGRVATAALVGRVSVLAIQSTQLGAALAEMPTGAYLLRFAKLMTGQLGWRTAMKSDFIRRRIEQAPPIVRQALDQLQAANKPSRLKYAMARVGETIAGADALFTAGTYAITYDYHLTQARKSGMSEADAERAATAAAIRSTERVAQPTREGTRSYLEVTARSSLRVSWAFASEARQKIALAAFALAKKSPAEAARALAVTWIAGGVVASLIRAAMRDIRDDEDEEWLDEKNWSIKRLGLSSLSGPFQGIPFLGDIIEGGIYKAAGEYLPEGNLFSSTGRIVDVAKRSPGYLDGERDLDDALRDVETVLTGAAPLVGDNTAAAASLSHIVRDAYAIMDNMLGEPGD